MKKVRFFRCVFLALGIILICYLFSKFGSGFLLGKENTNSDVLKQIIDVQTGQYVATDNDGSTVYLKKENGEVIWRLDLKKSYFKYLPTEIERGPNKIYSFSFITNGLFYGEKKFTNFIVVVCDNHHIGIDQKTGQIITSWGN
jgi:hypothetical protein